MNEEPKAASKSRFYDWPSPWFLASLVLLFFVGYVIDTPLNNPPQSSRAKKISYTRNDLASFRNALEVYHTDFGEYPSGDTRSIWRKLLGQNEKKVTYLNFKFSADTVSKEGDLLDPWGTPYRLEFSEGKPHVRSAGPNQRFDDVRDKNSDDIFQ